MLRFFFVHFFLFLFILRFDLHQMRLETFSKLIVSNWKCLFSKNSQNWDFKNQIVQAGRLGWLIYLHFKWFQVPTQTDLSFLRNFKISSICAIALFLFDASYTTEIEIYFLFYVIFVLVYLFLTYFFILFHFCSFLFIFVHYCSFLFILVHSCSFLFMLVHFCSLLFIPDYYL